MGADCDALPSSIPSSSKHPLSKSLRRSTSNLLVRDRGQESPSLFNQAILKASREQNLDQYYKLQQPSTPKSPFSLHTTPPPPSLPIAKSKHLSRSLTFSSLEMKPEKTLHPDCYSGPSTVSDPSMESNNVTFQDKAHRVAQQATQADGTAISAKFLLRSSTFSALRDPKVDQNTSEASPSPMSTVITDPAPASKSFLRSSSFVHKEQEFSTGKSFSRSMSTISSHGQEPEQRSDMISGFSKWARSFRSKPAPNQGMEIPESSPYSLLSGSSAKRASSRVSPIVEFENSFGVLTKGFLDSSRNAVKAVQDKARHFVSQNKQRHQDQQDMVYITENIIAVGFPGADISSNILGFMEGNYRDHIEEIVTFCEAQHPGKYKIFNLCSEKLYDTSLLYDKVACFPFEGNNCPPLQLVSAFCENAYTWLKSGLENVMVVHCKGGMARTGLMISCLLLHLKFFPTAEESMNYYNQKRSVDSKGLNLPSQLRYVKYYEQVLRKHHGFTPSGRRCNLRSIRLINCPSWIHPAVTVSDHDGVLFTSRKHPKTRSMLTEDLWLSAIKKGVFVLELPDNGHAATVDGDFKIQFQDRHAVFSCWLNTNMLEGNVVLRAIDLDGFDKGLQEATGFQVELELLDTSTLNSKATETGDDPAPTNMRPCWPSDMTAGRTSSCTNTAIFTDSEGEEEEESPGISARPSTERRDMREQEDSSSQGETLRSWATATTSQTAFQIALSNAVSEVSTGILNAMDRFGVTHLGGHTRSASVPNSPRISSHRHHQFGSARSADYEKDDWSTGSSRFQSSKEVLQKNFTFDFEKSGCAGNCSTSERENGDLNACHRETAGLSVDCGNPGASFRSDDPGSSFRSEDDGSLMPPMSDFQALAAASAADASLFTFGDDEDYESDEM